MWFTLLVQKRMALPTTPAHYHLLAKDTARIHYGVDHSGVLSGLSSVAGRLLTLILRRTYMSTVARDMGAQPSLFRLWWTHGWFIVLVYCFSAAFTTNYRLLGPFATPLAPKIVGTELWETVTRRGLIGSAS